VENKQSFSIKIKNFQSLLDADLVLDDGLTVVTGATNNGKSAIVRAVDAAVFNNGNDEEIKAGTDSFSVYLSNGEHSVEYIRRIKGRTDKTTYQFDNGEVQQKVGRTQLPEMEKFFNIREVRLQNNQKAMLNFWYQNEKPFLMDKTAGQLYEFLSVSSSEKYLSVLKTMNSDIKQEETNIKAMTVSIDLLKKELALKQDVLKYNDGFSAVYDNIIRLKEKDRRLTETGNIIYSIANVMETADKAKEVLRKTVLELDKIPMEEISCRMENITNGTGLVLEWEGLLKEVQELKGKIATAKEYAGVMIPRSEDFSKNILRLQNSLGIIGKGQEDVLLQDKAVQAFCSASELLQVRKKELGKLPDYNFVISKQEDWGRKVSYIEESNSWLADCRKQAEEVRAVVFAVRTAKNRLRVLQEDLDKSDREMDALKQELGVCPFCGAIFQ